MPLLSTSEALHVSDSFLSSLYGDVIFRRWKELKDEMKFRTEREYVSWLIDVANHYKNEDESLQLSHETDTNQFATSNVKSEEDLDHYNQCQGQSYESHLSSTQDTRNSKNYNEQFTLDTKAEGAGNSNEQTSVTSQVGDYEQSYYDDVGEEERMLEMERNDEIVLSPEYGDEFDEAASGTMDDDNDGFAELDPVENGKRFQCRHCSYRCVYKKDIKRHVLAVHEKQKPYLCRHCDHRCSEQSKMKRHLISMHGFKSRFCCRKCHKYFPTPSTLRKHILTTCRITT